MKPQEALLEWAEKAEIQESICTRYSNGVMLGYKFKVGEMCELNFRKYNGFKVTKIWYAFLNCKCQKCSFKKHF